MSNSKKSMPLPRYADDGVSLEELDAIIAADQLAARLAKNRKRLWEAAEEANDLHSGRSNHDKPVPTAVL